MIGKETHFNDWPHSFLVAVSYNTSMYSSDDWNRLLIIFSRKQIVDKLNKVYKSILHTLKITSQGLTIARKLLQLAHKNNSNLAALLIAVAMGNTKLD